MQIHVLNQVLGASDGECFIIFEWAFTANHRANGWHDVSRYFLQSAKSIHRDESGQFTQV